MLCSLSASMYHTCWVQSEVDKVVRCFGSNKIDFVSQLHRSLVLPLPLHNQLTLRDPLTLFKPICIFPGDLGSGYSMHTYS